MNFCQLPTLEWLNDSLFTNEGSVNDGKDSLCVLISQTVRIEVKQGPSTGLLNSRTVIIKIAMDDFRKAKSCFEKGRRFVQRVEESLFISLRKDGYNQYLMFFCSTIRIGLEGFHDGDVPSKKLLVTVLLYKFFQLGDPLNQMDITTYLVSLICNFSSPLVKSCLTCARSCL